MQVLRGLVAILALLATVLTVGVLVWFYHSGSLLSVASASMVPTFRRGDAVIVRSTDEAGVRVGQVVSYQSNSSPRLIISHRLVAINNHLLITRGDALNKNDDPVSSSHLVGRVVAVAPYLGYVIDSLKHPMGLLLFVYTPSTVVVAVQVRAMARYFNQPSYKLATR